MNISKRDISMLEEIIIGKQPSVEILGKYNDLLAEINKTREMESRNRKENLLKHYATKEPTEFYQFDGYGNDLPPEAAGDLDRRKTWELMDRCAVKVLITKETSKEEAVRLLLKITEWIVHVGFDGLERKKEEVPIIPDLDDWPPDFDVEVPL